MTERRIILALITVWTIWDAKSNTYPTSIQISCEEIVVEIIIKLVEAEAFNAPPPQLLTMLVTTIPIPSVFFFLTSLLPIPLCTTLILLLLLLSSWPSCLCRTTINNVVVVDYAASAVMIYNCNHTHKILCIDNCIVEYIVLFLIAILIDTVIMMITHRRNHIMIIIAIIIVITANGLDLDLILKIEVAIAAGVGIATSTSAAIAVEVIVKITIIFSATVTIAIICISVATKHHPTQAKSITPSTTSRTIPMCGRRTRRRVGSIIVVVVAAHCENIRPL
mmetsp:Transcript_6343/g.16030  ORF Transcript_6343/g.16030 Transcript_6343/m.16030 type:complete len:279 (-) Transcript_6343:141-977(-)